MGYGKQWIIRNNIDDVPLRIDIIIDKKEIECPLNITSPEPIRMKEFGETIATIMKKPHLLPVPSFMIHDFLGEMSILVLEGQHVLPNHSIEPGYEYTFPTIDHPLPNILTHTM